MRPLPGGDALSSHIKPRSRKSSVDDAAVASSHVPTAFFLRREEEMEMEQSSAACANTQPHTRPQEKSPFGVQSLADTLEAAFGAEDTPAAKRSSSCPSTKPSAPLTPLTLNVPSSAPTSGMPSTPSAVSLQSLKLSDEESSMDESSSQAIASSGEEDGAETTTHPRSTAVGFPQLVMPSIQMPSRRPFTTKGKAMGKLKVLVAGESGIGKTSLVRSIVQVCEDIVHVDPLSPPKSATHLPPPAASGSRRRSSNQPRPAIITETHASTKPYPPWWTDAEEGRQLRRRKSSLDAAVLERNICFVDTRGFSRGASEKEDMDRVVNYVESLLYQTSSVTTMEDSDVLGVVSGSGGVTVDVVLYLLPPNKDISADVIFMQRLSALTNVIPVLAKSDMLSAQEILALKTNILARLQTTSAKPFMFGKALEDALLAVQSLSIIHPQLQNSEHEQYPFTSPTFPYAISSSLGPDNETMDASLLMSPEYVQPLLPSELAALVEQVFEPDAIAWLRHSAAKKFLAWRRRTKLAGDSFILQSLQQPRSPTTTASVGLNRTTMNSSANSSVFSATSPSGVLVPQSGSPFYASNLQSPFSPSLAHSDLENPTSFSLARYHNNGQNEQPMTDISIAKWATDLQRSLRNERDRFEELQRNDRAKWLLERVGEEVSRGSIVASPGGSPRAEWAVVRRGDEKHSRTGSSSRYSKATGMDFRDLLGLCNFNDQVRKNGFVLVKVLGGVSVLGAIMVAVVKACGVEAGFPQSGWWSWITGGTE
ncbi:hypothetical protein ACEQ8H_003716 [Pleosporales sp. CAS-2024a]